MRLLVSRFLMRLVPSVRCRCGYFTCSYCGNCHNPSCANYGGCNQD
jgi:hypothetical protein